MRILITGGAGFIGRHIAEYFQDRAQVRVLDNLRCGFNGNLSGLNCQLIVGSKGVDFVFHLAAMVSVQESVEKPNECDCFGRGGAGASEKADLQQLGCNLRRQSNRSKD
jgi:UDP-glucose 4-epimerase